MDEIQEQFEQAKALSRSGQNLEAATLFCQIADGLLPDKGCVAFYLLAADELDKSGKSDDAISICRKAISIDPNSVSAWRSLGSILAMEGDDVEAERALRMSLSLKPTATACIYLNSVCFSQDRLEEAEMLCQQALRLSPDFDEAYYNLSRIKRKQSCWDEAVEALQSALDISPDYDLAHREMASILFDLQDLENAKYHAQIACRLNPNDHDANTLLIRIRDCIEGRF